MVATQHRMRNDGYVAKIESKLSVQKDHFVSSPAYHILVGDILKQVKELDAAAESATRSIKDTIEKIDKGSRAINDFCDALFTGVISMEGRVLTYRTNNFGVVTEKVLSKRGEEFPFNTIPVYQGFLSYQNILTAEDHRRQAESRAGRQQDTGRDHERGVVPREGGYPGVHRQAQATVQYFLHGKRDLSSFGISAAG